MKIRQVIKLIAKAETGSRSIDEEIALLMGWRRLESVSVDMETQQSLVTKVWMNPSTNARDKYPRYTVNLQAAYDLAQQISPSHIGGFDEKDGVVRVRLGLEGKLHEAATPQLAICLAALMLFAQQHEAIA